MKNSSPFRRTLCDGWDLICDLSLPKSCYPADSGRGRTQYSFNPLYSVVLWAAFWAVAAIILGKLLTALLPGNGAALLFVIIISIASEMRTSFRGMALTVSCLENLFSGKNFTQSLLLRQSDLRNISGVVPLLLAVAFAGCRFFTLFLAAKSGCFGVIGTAWLIAVGAEGFLAAEPAAVNMPKFCSDVKSEYIVAMAGFFLIFSLIAMPLATLLAVGVAAVMVITFMNLLLKNTGKIESNDMTMTGYLLETAVLLIFAIILG